jgi:hypothetical protein
MTKKVFPEIVDMKSRIHKAYKILEDKGYFCGYSWTCCNTCGWSEIPEDKDMEKVVFFHNQEEDDLKENGSCYLAWAGDPAVIMGAFGFVGILTQWDGDKDRKIRIIHPSAKVDGVV